MHKTYDFANILLSGPCNQRCPYCIGKQVAPRLNRYNLDTFPLRNLERFTALIRQHHIRQIVLTGTNTDPQLYHHETRLIRWLRDRVPEAKISLHTNAQLALVKMDTFNMYDKTVISLPAFIPNIFEQMTGVRHMPDIEAILQAAHVPVKISCVVNEHNVAHVCTFLDRCRQLGVRRVVLRYLYGETRTWALLPGHRPVRSYRNNPVYDYEGIEATVWRFGTSTSTSLNLFSDGTITDRYLLAATPGLSKLRPPLQVHTVPGTVRPTYHIAK